MCLSKPKAPQIVQAPAPIPPSAPIEEDKAPKVETAVDVDTDLELKKKKKVGTTALQTSSGLNIPTTSGLNIT
jgi:hypothetical protein